MVAPEQAEAIESTAVTFAIIALVMQFGLHTTGFGNVFLPLQRKTGPWSSVNSVRGDLSSGTDQPLLSVYRITRRGGYSKERVHARRLASACIGEPACRHSIADIAFLCRPRRAVVQRQSAAPPRMKDVVTARNDAVCRNVRCTSSVFRGLGRNRTHPRYRLGGLDFRQTCIHLFDVTDQLVYHIAKART